MNQEKIFPSSQWSKLVKTRDGWRCANQDALPHLQHTLFQLNAHHITPKKIGGTNALPNGITYCRACHAAEHPEYQQKFIGDFTFSKMALQLFDFGRRLLGKPQELRYRAALEFLTGSSSFRSLQMPILHAIVEEKKHIIAVLPTGVGKSLLYQIPGILEDTSKTLIITPLKALQMDQVSKLVQRWVPATYINSSLDQTEIDRRLQAIKSGEIRFVFIHPKQLLHYTESSGQIGIKSYKELCQIPFNRLVIDEAHVVKHMGLSFVKEYYGLYHLFRHFKFSQLVMLSASASQKTRELLTRNLQLNPASTRTFVGGFYRPEISLQVVKTNFKQTVRDSSGVLQTMFVNHDETLLHLLRECRGKVIIFVTTIAQAENVYAIMRNNNLEAVLHHGKLSDLEKETSHRQFASNHSANTTSIMVATSGYGMGIDVSSVRTVIHYSLPLSLNDYYQQIGRAGRDGKPATACLLYNVEEADSLVSYIYKKAIEQEHDAEFKALLDTLAKEELRALRKYVQAENKWQYLLRYFGDEGAIEQDQSQQRLTKLLVLFAVLILTLFYLLNR